ncbi:MAG: hypothetical protein JWO31_1181 [Phycisphaerales bacterium]|nr:hypothetical protein [Phycisphaerales bacterium]
MKLIFLILGLGVGFFGGIYYGINHPKEAADLNAKQQEWVRQGKEQALQQVKDKLDGILNQQKPAAPAAPGFARSFAGGTGSGGGVSQTDALAALKGDVESQLNQVKAGK